MNKLPNELRADGRYSTITMFNDRGSTKYLQAYNKGDNIFRK